ncbi:hypothetical protein L345_16975, partial [Ophiophagus hannah]
MVMVEYFGNIKREGREGWFKLTPKLFNMDLHLASTPLKNAGPSWLGLGCSPAAGLVLSTPSFPVSVSHGETALLPVSLNFSSSVPTYFQIRWRFITGPWLVLIVKADNCKGDSGTRQWWDACEITVAKAERYRHRAEWSSKGTSLILRDARVEDSGIYEIKVLALGVRVSANLNLTVGVTTWAWPHDWVGVASFLQQQYHHPCPLGGSCSVFGPPGPQGNLWGGSFLRHPHTLFLGLLGLREAFWGVMLCFWASWASGKPPGGSFLQHPHTLFLGLLGLLEASWGEASWGVILCFWASWASGKPPGGHFCSQEASLEPRKAKN